MTRRRGRRWLRWRNREARRYSLVTRRERDGNLPLSAADVRDMLGTADEWQPGASREACGGPRTKGARTCFVKASGCGCEMCESGYCCGWARWW
jgi:hypothetical protein